ncbi:uncharacterized protein LOC119579198 [Penaeus monodon]|uniref:uncharacterized protein LOC119579198 n=1 Tax=Penaeus monodon TaxID=6687 RepID=UPI0018A7B6EB|nr:uncharacterized protein LOC119579198 [Penaeus monodon]
MDGCVAFLWACLAVLWASSLPAHTASSSVTFRRFEGRQVTTNIISETSFPKSPRKGTMECSAFCHSTPGCLSFNLGNSAPYRCQLLRLKEGDTVVSNTDFDQFISTSASVVPVEASNGGPWGTWHAWVYCLPGSYMNAYQIKVQLFCHE